MTKTLSKSKSDHGSKHGGTRRGKSTHVKKGFVRTLAKQRKRYYAMNECGIYVADESI